MRFKHSIISAVCEFCAHPLPSKHLMDFLRLNSGGTGSCLNLCVLVKGRRSEGSCLGSPGPPAALSGPGGGETSLKPAWLSQTVECKNKRGNLTRTVRKHWPTSRE